MASKSKQPVSKVSTRSTKPSTKPSSELEMDKQMDHDEELHDDSQTSECATTTPCNGNVDSQNPCNSQTSALNPSLPSEVSMAAIQQSICEMNKNLSDKLGSIHKDLQNIKGEVSDIKVRVTSLELKLPSYEETLSFHSTEIDQLNTKIPEIQINMKNQIDDLEKKLLRLEIHDRKCNLLFYGIPKHNEDENSEAVLKEFITSEMHLDSERASDLQFGNVHRLRKPTNVSEYNANSPPCIIARFLHFNDKDWVLHSASTLRGKKFSIRSDLPPVMKRERGRLGSIAYRLRTEDSKQTRIRVVDTTVILETRPSSGLGPWLPFKEV